MDFLEPRKAYHRTQTDDFDFKPQDYNVELSSLRTQPSFQNSFSNTIRDQSPLLHSDADPIRKDPAFFSKTSLQSLKLPFSIWPASLYGWRTGALTAALLAGISLLINFVAVIWLRAHGHGSSLVELYNGDCDKAESADVWVHLAINVLSTLLLGGSNYCMQCLSAPTRGDVDRAHAKAKFLDVGVPSVRNLQSIPVYKMLLWWGLGLSSVPLHLMYNSAFYKSLAANDYNMYFVTQDFVDGKPLGKLEDVYSPYTHYLIDPAELQTSLTNGSVSWERLDNEACINAYATTFLDNRRSLILVSENATRSSNESFMSASTYVFAPIFAFEWICTSDSNMSSKIDMPGGVSVVPCATYVDKVAAIADQWRPFDFHVQYCLSERVPQQCSYSGNIPIVAIVLVANAVKVGIMLFVAFRLKDSPLITIGDAVESFLNHNDDTTKGQCLLSRNDVIHTGRLGKQQSVQERAKNGEIAATPRMLARRTRQRWAQAASGTRWSFTVGFLLLAMGVTSGLLGLAVVTVRSYFYSISDLGFGKVAPAGIITGWGVGLYGTTSTKIISAVLIANLPQTILSFLYLNLNGLLTSMWLASEWSDFATDRKTLRVSKPKGQQRSTHFLQLPYKIAVPLMILSGLLHWLISQSIFLAVIAEYDPNGAMLDMTAVASCGFSPLAMIIVIVLGVVVITAIFLLGWFRRYDGSIPLVGSCSAAISAACHQPSWDTDASSNAVRWGAIPDIVDEKGVGHCGFSSGEVEPVVEGREYAGIPDQKLIMRRRT